MTQVYIIAGIAILVLFLISRIIRWWNLPKVVEERRKRVESRQQGRTERLRDRLQRRWGRRE